MDDSKYDECSKKDGHSNQSTSFNVTTTEDHQKVLVDICKHDCGKPIHIGACQKLENDKHREVDRDDNIPMNITDLGVSQKEDVIPNI